MAGRTIHTDRFPVKGYHGAVQKLVEADEPRSRSLEELIGALDVIVMAMGVSHVEKTQTACADKV
jgi:hypothetical protein